MCTNRLACTFRSLALEASPDHFLLVSSNTAQSASFASARLSLRAKDVRPGHVMWTHTASGLQAAMVEDVALVSQSGLFNPYTAAGTIVVNGVVATVHSRWFLDTALDTLGLTAFLPGAYQVSLYGYMRLPAFILFAQHTMLSPFASWSINIW